MPTTETSLLRFTESGERKVIKITRRSDYKKWHIEGPKNRHGGSCYTGSSAIFGYHTTRGQPATEKRIIKEVVADETKKMHEDGFMNVEVEEVIDDSM